MIPNGGELRAVHLSLQALEPHLPGHLRSCTDNTAVMNIMKKGNAHSQTLVGEAFVIEQALRKEGIQATWNYVVSGSDPADGISRGQAIKSDGLREGERGGGGLLVHPTPSVRQRQNIL